jgi:hypothetical protein
MSPPSMLPLPQPFLANSANMNMTEHPELADSSVLFFADYFRKLEKVHGRKVESWKKDADSVLIFVSP